MLLERFNHFYKYQHLGTFVLDSKLILLRLGCFIVIWSTSIFCNFCLFFCCSNIVVFSVRIFRKSVFELECFLDVVLLNWY